jgi:hypothetical protein
MSRHFSASSKLTDSPAWIISFLLARGLPAALRLYEYDIMKVDIRTGSGLTKIKTSLKDIPSTAIKRMLEELGTCPHSPKLQSLYTIIGGK